MNVISRKHIERYGVKQASARKPLEAWYKIMSKMEFQTIMELREVFNSVDPVHEYTIFNIAGNRYRLITKMNYENQVCMIKKIMTHSEYDKWSAE